MSASSCRCAPGCGRASAPAARLQNWTFCWCAELVVGLLWLPSPHANAGRGDAAVRQRGFSRVNETEKSPRGDCAGKRFTTRTAVPGVAASSQDGAFASSTRRLGAPARQFESIRKTALVFARVLPADRSAREAGCVLHTWTSLAAFEAVCLVSRRGRHNLSKRIGFQPKSSPGAARRASTAAQLGTLPQKQRATAAA